MFTLPSRCGDVDGPTHTLVSTEGGDFIEPMTEKILLGSAGRIGLP